MIGSLMATDGGSGEGIGSDKALCRVVSGKKEKIVRPGIKLRENRIMMVESQKNVLVPGGDEFVRIVSFATANGSKI